MVHKNKDPIKAIIEINPCGLCRAIGNLICPGHGGKGGGSSGGSDGNSGETKNKNAAYISYQTVSISGQVTIPAIQEFDQAKAIWVQSQLFSNRVINYEAGLLSIESDRLRGNLTFQVQPGLSRDDIEISRQFLKAVNAAFDDFKNQLAEQGVSTKNFNAVIKDNELTIHIPNPKYYDAFIKHLESKNLLPIPNPKQHEIKEKMRPSPFDAILKGPRPKGMKNDK